MSEQQAATFSLKSVIISAIMLVAAFILTKLFLQFMIYEISDRFGYEPSFGFNQIHTISDFHKWTRMRVFAVNLFPPTVCLLLGVGLYYWMRDQTHSWGYLQFFAYWSMVCLVNAFSAQFIFAPLGVDDTSSPFYQTLAIVEVWCYMPVQLAAAGAVMVMLATAATGYLLSVETVKLSHSQRLVSENTGKNIVILQLYVLPVVLASVPLFFLSKGFYALPLAVAEISLILFTVGMFLRNWQGPYRVRFQKTDVSVGFIFAALALTAALWAVVYIYFR